MTTKFTILLPVIREPMLLPQAIESVLAQTLGDFDLAVICDGAPPATVKSAQNFAAQDKRVRVYDFEKDARVGEMYWHRVLAAADSAFVAHIEDDDLWFPSHLEEMARLLSDVDFGHSIHVTGCPDGSVRALPSDIGDAEFRQRFLGDVFNRFGYSFCGYRLDAYRALPEGWVPTPPGVYPDLHMWRKFFHMPGFKFATNMRVTAVAVPGYQREQMADPERQAESIAWLKRTFDPAERDKITAEAWRCVIQEGFGYERESIRAAIALREMQAAIAEIESLHPGSLAAKQSSIANAAATRLELERTTEDLRISRHAVDHFNAELTKVMREHKKLQIALADLRRGK